MIRQILEKLTSEQRDQLMAAFEQELASFVELPEGKFVGVNVGPLTALEIECTEGDWFYGSIKGANDASLHEKDQK